MLAAALFSIAVSAGGAADLSSLMASNLAQLRSRGTLNVAGEEICADRMVVDFYARRMNQPAWSPKMVTTLLGAIRAADTEGLRPDDYHLEAIGSLGANDPPSIAARELLATDAFLLLALHLTQGRVNPVSLIHEWCVAPRRIDLAAVLQAALDAEDIEGTLRALAPQHDAYRQLRAALAAYRDAERRGGWPPLTPGRSLRAGDRGARVIELRKRLAAEPMAEPVNVTDDRFDQELDLAVRRFQARHAVAVDGVVGRATRGELDVAAAERVDQIELNMERWRWMPEEMGDSYALVNIAAFRLDVVEKNRTVLSMKTVVGRSFWETPFFPARITEIVVNPSWNVPANIADRELWPKQLRNRAYLASQHIVVERGGSLRQLPGPWNSLGRIKFNMPNPFTVYLHDTPARELFAPQTRAFSHGCIRVEKAAELALYLLRDQPEWSADILASAVDAGKERVVPLTTPEPVYVLYWTACPGASGEIEFHPDVYRRDAELQHALESPVTRAQSGGH